MHKDMTTKTTTHRRHAWRARRLARRALLLATGMLLHEVAPVPSSARVGAAAAHAQAAPAPPARAGGPASHTEPHATPWTAPIPLEGGDATALGVALRRLGTTKRVLMIAAHPDDENTALLAELALGDGADVAYLSLTRGEGGQNLIGPELQEGLGIIRSEELLTARRLDGARQFFTRAYDFGFSRSADETLREWPRDSILADVVAVIRRYRPDIVVSVFSGTPADGHGHHQAAGILAREAFSAAADPTRFPGQIAGGMGAHRAHYLFQSMWRPPADPPLALETGRLDPLFGRSRHQVAMQSRSRHRSQDMGQAESPGPQRVALRVLAGDHPPGARSLFAGVDTLLSQRARAAGTTVGAARTLEQYEERVQQLRAAFNPLYPAATANRLIDAHAVLRQALDVGGDALAPLVHAELARVEQALALAAGIVVDATADSPQPVPGESFSLTLTAWNGGAEEARLHRLEPLLPGGWTAVPETSGMPAVIPPQQLVRRRFTVTVPPAAGPTEPYFLRVPRQGSSYAWPPDGEERGLPFEPRPVRMVAEVGLGPTVRLERDAVFVSIDKSIGELREPLLVVPAVSVTSASPITVIPVAQLAQPRALGVTVSSAAASAVAGTLRIHAPAGWRVEPASVELALQRRGDARTVTFSVVPPREFAGEAVLHPRFETARGTFARGYTVIDYPHIQPRALYRDAAVRVSAFPVAIAPNLRIGYIEGAGDDGAAALRQLGATVDLLDAAALAGADLSPYDAIIAGIRAYEVRPDIIAHNARLLEYARRGGTFVVQYNKYELVDDGGFMPFPATMARPHGRVTDEGAAVTLLEPDHPLLAGPNRITTADFDGWVQERGLYYLDTFAPEYTPLLSMADAGEPPQRGSLVAARVGSGWYVYTGLALFRQLPEGVPGAWRLLANLASLGSGTAP